MSRRSQSSRKSGSFQQQRNTLRKRKKINSDSRENQARKAKAKPKPKKAKTHPTSPERNQLLLKSNQPLLKKYWVLKFWFRSWYWSLPQATWFSLDHLNSKLSQCFRRRKEERERRVDGRERERWSRIKNDLHKYWYYIIMGNSEAKKKKQE